MAAELSKVEADEASDVTEYTIYDGFNEVAKVNDTADDIQVGGWTLCPAKLLAKLAELYDIRPDTLAASKD